MFWRRRREQELADAREEALRWYERLGGQIANLPSGDTPAVKQAMTDAGERYNAAGAQLDRADSPKQFELARETALEGLAYIQAARTALGLDAGPELPPLAAQRGVGAIREPRRVDVEGREFRAAPQPAADTPYYYPGGRIQGRPVPMGWYSEPWWRSAVGTGAGVFGGLLLFDALAGGFNDYGYDQGYEQGLDYADQHGWDPGGDQSQDQGDYQTASYDDGSYDDGGGYDGGGFDGGDFGSF
jgi:hypothetical protein